jgi:hypothetical protein
LKEKLQEYALIAEIISGVAVVATLGILIMSVRQNTEITRAMMFADVQRDSSELERLALMDAELNEIYSAYLEMRTPELTEPQQRRVMRIVVNSAANYDSKFAMRNAGLLGPNEWEIGSRYLCTSYERAISAGHEDVFLALISLELQDYVGATCGPK